MKKLVVLFLALLFVLPVMCYASSIEVQEDSVAVGNAVKLDFQGELDVTFDGQDTAVIDFDGWTHEVVSATEDTVTAADNKTVFISTDPDDATTFQLPTAAAGLQYTFAAGVGGVALKVDPVTPTDTIVYLTLDAGDEIDSNSTTGDSVTLAGAATKWYVIGMGSSAWTDGGAS